MFLTSLLKSLVQSLRKTDVSQFKTLKSLISTRYPTFDFKLVLRKHFLPYEYLDTFDKFDDYDLPFLKSFSITLRSEKCFQENYD